MWRWGRGVGILPHVGLGWPAPLMMSRREHGTPVGSHSGSENRAGGPRKLERIQNSILYTLVRSKEARRLGEITPTGFAHTFAVCMLELDAMARGKGDKEKTGNVVGMPTFVDIKLDAETRRNFLVWSGGDHDVLKILADFADTGYRVGCSWSGEHQSYTISITCRSGEQPNNGLCMTSFARTIEQGVLLAWYKHSVLAKGAWRTYAPEAEEGFG